MANIGFQDRISVRQTSHNASFENMVGYAPVQIRALDFGPDHQTFIAIMVDFLDFEGPVVGPGFSSYQKWVDNQWLG